MARKKLHGLTPEAFIAENDQRALDALRKVPLLPKIVQKFYEVGADRWLYCYHMAMCVRCGPKQYGTVYETMREACSVLDMPEPELYLTSNPFPNAFAGGVERPYVIVRNSMLDTMTDEQLYHLIGHELGHIKAGHILYMSVAQVLMPLLEMIGRRTLGLGDVASAGLVMAFAEWSRQAEITADRAGLLASQDITVSTGANLAMCAGPSRFVHEQNLDAFMDQARAYQDMNAWDSVGKVLMFMLMTNSSTHPMPVHRTQELDRWYQNGSFARIMAGDYSGNG